MAALVAACIMIVLAGPGSVASAASPRVDRGGPVAVECIDRHARPLATTGPAEPVGDLRPVVITMAVHEPLNEVIRDAGDPARIADPAAVRDDFHETRWVAWHIVQTIATTAAFGCLAWALVLHGRATADTADTADHEEIRPAQTLGSP